MQELFIFGVGFGGRGCIFFRGADIDGTDRGFEEADFGTGLAGFDGDSIFLHADDLTDDPADGGDFISDLESIAHSGGFFFLFLLLTTLSSQLAQPIPNEGHNQNT